MATARSGTKKSLFKKPTWASTTATATTDENAPIFGQSHLYQEILQKERELRERHAAKQKERAEREKAKQVVNERENKRRRISTEAEDSDYGSASDSRSVRSKSAISDRSEKSTTPVKEEPTRILRSAPTESRDPLSDKSNLVHSPRKGRKRKSSSTKDEVIILDLDDDDDDPTIQGDKDESSVNQPATTTANSTTKRHVKDPDPESEEEDEYLRELKAKARQEARSKRLGIGTHKAATPDPSTTQTVGGNHPPIAEKHSPYSNRATSTPAAEDEAEVQIYITTLIPNAKDVIVNRKVGQPLDKVKEYWIRHNKLDPAIAEKVFFTWNNTRLYNSTTMRGIIERLKKTYPRPDGSDPSQGKIMIEAVTDEIHEYRLQQKARRQAEEAASNDQTTDTQNHDPSNTTDAANEDETPAPQQNRMIIRLKAQNYEDRPIRVRPNSTMRKIILAFLKVHNIDPETHSQIWLSYDGDKLAEDDTVEEVGFEHDDTVEVYFR